ncbi:conserved membrane hypothetical protein [Brochothrix thermosphacta]|uniref:ABC transporter permease n=1 Tax=Brochothrix thermosphacta TaxID=2756 RepID=UPI000D7A713D|nr:ABC transporter permease subunit [Brochothrix thermosphacta]SPP27061.1 conserved membrane hypothetical protein [Brochothrix thermosphacta]
MYALIQNEIAKLWYRKSTLVFILLTFIFGFGFAYLSKRFEIVPGGADYFSTLGGQTSFINLFIVIVASTIVATEFSQGTIKFLLIRPYSRTQIMLSKIITTFVMAIVLSLLLFASSYLGTLVFFDNVDLLANMSSTVSVSAMGLALRTISANLLLMIFYIMISVFISASFRSQALAVGLGTAILFSSSILNAISTIVMQKYHWLRWNPFNTLNIKEAVLPKSAQFLDYQLSATEMIIALCCYIVLFYIISQLVFNRRDVTLS